MTEVADLFVILRAETAPFASGMRTAATEGESFTAKMGGVSAAMSKVGAETAAVGVGVAVVSVKMAGDFQASMQKLVTTAGESQANLGKVSQGVKDIAVQTGTSTKSLADGMYMVESAGFHGADGLKVLSAAAQGARAEQAPLAEVSNAVTSALKSYHLPASAAVQITNQMVAAVGHGKMTFSEFSSSLSTVLPIASSAHLGFDQVGGAIATLTNHGTSAREATQELAFSIRSLQAPNNVAVQEMQRLGLSSVDVSTHLGQRGLTGTIQMLQQAVLQHMGPAGTVLLNAFNTSKQAAADATAMISQMPPSLQKLAQSYASGSLSVTEWKKQIKALPVDQANLANQFATLENKSKGFNTQLKSGGPAEQTYNDAMKKMMGGATGLNTALMLGGENMGDFKNNVAAVGKAGQGAGKNIEGWDKTQKTFNVQMGQLKERVEVAGITIGTKLIPIVSSVIGFFTKHKTITEGLAVAIGVVLTGAVVKFIAGALSPLVKAVSGISTVIGKIPWSGITSGAGSAFDTLRLKGMYAWDGIKSGASGMRTAAVSALDTVRLKGMYAWDGVKSGAQTAGKAVADFGSKAATATKAAGEAAWSGTVKGVKAVGGAMKTAALASLEYAKSTATAVAASVRAAVAWTAEKVALIATSIAEKAAALAQWLLNAAMDANPVTLIVIAIAALVAVLIYAYNHSKTFREIVQAAFRAVATVAMWLWHNVFEPVFHGIATAVGWVVDFIKAHWPLLLAILTGPIGIAVLLITKYWRQISDAFSTAYHAVIDTVVSLVTWIAGLPGKILSALASLGKQLWTWATEAWNRAKSAAVTVATAYVTWVIELPGKILNALSSLGSSLWNWATSAFSQAWHAAINVVLTLMNWANGIPGRVLSALGSLGSLLWSAGSDLIWGLIHGVESAASTLFSYISNIGSSVSGAFKSVLSIFSPSRVFMSHGVNIVAGLVQGLQQGAPAAVGASRDLATATTRGFGNPQLALAGGTSGSALALAGSGGGTVVNNNYVTISPQGSILAERDLRDVMQRQMLQLGARNSQTWQPYHR
ncbi:phage tail tape measure protein [Streptomyces sp. SDr-06]|uniref:phage tail tape measure protein n=1 Tax=Streptomyces sp. SDr-06 TaxID=2267702 RepID=UPI000DEA4ED9|nr:phage tail tape measure protein [Streptomyces sp. SDr-06]RCH70433.1 phage tail tape measure protein [Streptomyces sp. SDr-06]